MKLICMSCIFSFLAITGLHAENNITTKQQPVHNKSIESSSSVPFRFYKEQSQETMFFAKKLQEILETKIKETQDTGYLDTEDESWQELIHVLSHVVGHCITVPILFYFISAPYSWFDFFKQILIAFVCITIGGGLIGNFICAPIITSIVKLIRLLSQSEQPEFHLIYRETLIEFIRHWQEFKIFTPLPLHDQIDDLYQQYLKHHAQLLVSEDEALRIVEHLIEEGLEYERSIKFGTLG